ncbi:MAG: dTMP kinase [Thermodesulfovibrionales bacterium]
MKGIFVSLEGIEGTGKSTQVRLLAGLLRSRGLSVTETAEPGGTPISLRIREILLSLESTDMTPVTELLLYNAARVQHIAAVISPALERGDIVITDRFSDSTIAYQGYGRDIDLELITSLDAIATNKLRPDLTLLLDIDVETGLRRNRAVNKEDRLEREDVSFHEKVRRGFISLAGKEPDRIKRIDCSGGIDEVHRSVADIVTAFLKTRGSL